MYVSEIIGDEYKNWKQGESVLISQTTGSGKTCFILNCLLPYAKCQGKHLVYYCNRKFLNLQVQASASRKIYNEMGEDTEGLKNYLHIRTYQHTERYKDYPNVLRIREDGTVVHGQYEVEAEDVLYYLYDEAMYMVQDASFNSSTRYWFKEQKITANKNGISVFLTAMPEPLFVYQAICRYGLDQCYENYIAKKALLRSSNFARWAYFLGYRCRYDEEGVLNTIGDPYEELFGGLEDAYSDSSWLNHRYEEKKSLTECYSYADTYYFDDISSMAKIIASSVTNKSGHAQKKTD